MSVATEEMTRSEPIKELLTPIEMAAYIGWSRSHLDKIVAANPIFPVNRSGKKVQFNWRQVMAFLESPAGRNLDTKPEPKKRGRK